MGDTFSGQTGTLTDEIMPEGPKTRRHVFRCSFASIEDRNSRGSKV